MSPDIKNTIKIGVGRAASWLRLDRQIFASKMVVVAFHRVNDQLPEDALTCSSATFEAFCQYFKSHFNVVSLEEQVAASYQQRPAGGTLSITFDDGYLDNYEVAAPILERLGLTATFFVSTKFIGSKKVPTWDQQLPFQPGWMNWDQVADLSARGFIIGGHTETHIDLGKADSQIIRAELAASKQTLRDRLGKSVELFAYPFGGRTNLTEASLQLVREAGFTCCVSCCGGFNPTIAVPFRLSRIAISPWFKSPYQFGAELALGRIGTNDASH